MIVRSVEHRVVPSPMAPAPSAGDFIPSFRPFPDLKCFSWCSEELHGTHDELAKERDGIIADQGAMIDKLRKRIDADPMSLTVSKPGARQKEEYALIDREIAWRKRFSSYCVELATQAKAEGERLIVEWRVVRDKVEERIVSALTGAGVDKSIYSDRLHMFVSVSKDANEAKQKTVKLGLQIDRLREIRHEALVKQCLERQAELKAELVAMC